MDMEFYQFHPTALRLEGAPTFLLSEAMRGEGAVLRNIEGEAFMGNYHSMSDLAPRDVVSRAIVVEMEKARSTHILLDVTHLPVAKVKSRFPTIYSFCLRYGLDITTRAIPVAPAAHYMMGGVKTDLWGATTLHNLYACGEVSCNALHGANRLASNSLLDTLVFAKRVVDKITGNTDGVAVPSRVEVVHRLEDKPARSFSAPEPSLSALQELMWSKVGMVRSASRLEEALKVLSTWGRSVKVTKDKASLELSNLVLVGRLIGEGARIREESRGAHYREDFPQTSLPWGKHIVIAQKEV
jgi:L-aspartate oxidase